MSHTAPFMVCDEDPEVIADEWQELVDEADPENIFLRPDWHHLWSHVFGNGQPARAKTVRDGERLLGLANVTEFDGVLTLAGDANVWDYAGMPLRPGFEQVALDALIASFADEHWKEVILWGLKEDSALLRELPGVAKEHGFAVDQEVEAVCPEIALPDSWEDYLGSLNKKDRHELRRKMRRFGELEGHAELLVLTEPDEVLAALPDFIRLHIASRTDKAEFMTTEMQHFFRHVAGDMALHHRIRLYLLRVGTEAVASLLCFDAVDSLLLYNSGYDPVYSHASVGVVSKALCLQDAIANGKRRFNFLRGDERYKYDLGARDTMVYRCRLTRVDG